MFEEASVKTRRDTKVSSLIKVAFIDRESEVRVWITD